MNIEQNASLIQALVYWLRISSWQNTEATYLFIYSLQIAESLQCLIIAQFQTHQGLSPGVWFPERTFVWEVQQVIN